jgi:hypothetical protein
VRWRWSRTAGKRRALRTQGPRYTTEEIFTALYELWERRKPAEERFTVFNDAGEPIAAFDSRGHNAVWPFNAGAPE